jgi:carboxylate-amine ligase
MAEREGQVKPELMESVLEIATEPCRNTAEAGDQLRSLRDQVRDVAAERDLTIASAGTHPFALWEEQRIVPRDRYRDLVAVLGFVARQELIFGTHVHVGLDDPDKAVFVANGMRLHIPMLLALSANSPFWRSARTGMVSSRTPIFRAFPRVGIPPAYRDFDDFAARIEFMVECRVMSDYTFLWYDVRPHPNFGTVEVRVMDGQTRVEHTLGIAALVHALVRELGVGFDEGVPVDELPTEMLDENKWLAARLGLEGELVDLPGPDRMLTRDLIRRTIDRVRGHAEDLGSAGELEGVEDLLEQGTGASRQLHVYGANQDLREVMAELIRSTGS